MELSWLQIVLSLIVLGGIPLFGLRVFRKLHILEHIKRANYYNRQPVVNAQGIWLRITLISLILVLGRNFTWGPYFRSYLIAWSCLVIIASIDLFWRIPSWLRLILQIVIFWGIILYWGIEIESIRIWSDNLTLPSRLAIAWSIIRFVLCTNAINRFDGIQAQASGVTSIGSFSLLAVVSLIVLPSYGADLTPLIQEQLTLTQIIALALWLVALIYSIIEYKPKWLIRDIGTTVYGFSLAYIALLWWAKVWTLVVVLSLVIFDSIWVILYRIFILRKNPMKWDYTHFHHRLLANWRNRSEVRRFVWIWSVVLSILMILQGTNSWNKWIIFLLLACLFFWVHIYLFWIKKLPTAENIHFDTSEVESLN